MQPEYRCYWSGIEEGGVIGHEGGGGAWAYDIEGMARGEGGYV